MDTRDMIVSALLVVVFIVVSYVVAFKIKNKDITAERIRFFKTKASAVKGLAIGCFFLEELPQGLFIDKMRTRPMVALVGLKLKAKALGMSVIILGYPGLLVGLMMDGDDVVDVEIVGWGMMNAPLIKRMHAAMAFKAMLKGWVFEHGLKIIAVSGVYWVGSRKFCQGRGYPPVNLGGCWVACDKETNYHEIAGMLNNSDFND